MHRPLSLAFALALLLGASGPALAEEAPPPTWTSLTAGLPAPDAAHAFRYEGKILGEGRLQALVVFSAQPGDDGTWVIEESMRLPDGSPIGTNEVVLDAHLAPVRGRSYGPAEAVDVVWRREGGTFHMKVTHTESGEDHPAGAVVEHSLEHVGPVTTSMSAMWLLVRMAPEAAGRIEVGVLDADAGAGQGRVDTMVLEIGAQGTWQGAPARLMHAERKGQTFEIAFDPKDGTWLGMRNPVDDSLQVLPVRSMEAAAVDAATAFGTGDVTLLGKVIHWPTVRATMIADGAFQGAEGGPPSVEALKASILAQLEQTLTKRPAGTIRGVLEAIAPQIRFEKRPDGRTDAIFPAMFEGLVLTLGTVDGDAYLVELPAEPEAPTEAE